jgi:hypothetical protein
VKGLDLDLILSTFWPQNALLADFVKFRNPQ